MEIGTVLVNSWGWEQTNKDFYQVVRKTATSVWLVKLPKKIEPGQGCSDMAGYATPLEPAADAYVLGPKRIGKDGKSVRFPHGWTGVWDGKPEYVSWYA